ncbi:MAG: alpha/beta hydrolase, partial [Phycisphaerales bacterium]|nr:alpha/beta hydrolase [Phycisphaerales bacterium]
MLRRAPLAIFLVLLVASAALTWPRPAPSEHLAISKWGTDTVSDGAFPVVLLHGSPGSKENFDALGPRLGATRPTYAFDLPGFGASTGPRDDYGAREASVEVLAELDRLGLGRVHVVGWSFGSAVALHMASSDPDRVVSLCLIGGIGAQEVEGSGDYTFEHLKYRVSEPFVVALPELMPHFGLFGHWTRRYAFIRSFMDLDQRPIRAMMERLETPVLILHGRDDFLVPARAALLHHEILPHSRLELIDGSHFLPFAQVEETTQRLDAHFASIEDGTFAEATRIESSPLPTWRRLAMGVGEDLRALPVLVLILSIALGATFFEDLTIVVAGLLVAAVELDLGVAFAGVGLGMAFEALGLMQVPHAEPLTPYWRARIERFPIRTGLGARVQRGRCESQFRAVSASFACRHPRWVIASIVGGVLKALFGLVV